MPMNKSRTFEKIGVICVYLFSSVLTTVVNKYVISVLNFHMMFFYLGIQSLFIALVLFILSLIKIITIKPLTIQSMLSWLPCAILLTLMIFTSAKSMRYLSISLHTLLKDFTIIISATGEYILYKRKIDNNTISAFFLVIISSSLAKISEIPIQIVGLAWCLLNIISTSSYILLYKYNIEMCKTSNSESVFYCNFLSVPCLIIGFMFFDQADIRLLHYNHNTYKILFFIAMSSTSAFFISYSTAWCLRLLSSTTLAMLGALNKMLISFSGIVFIGEKNVCFLKIVSLIVGFLAGLVYSKRIREE